ncbi:hypothetical protein D3C84_1195800 [compost metagenome]
MRVKATNAEMSTDTATVRPNWRNITPEIPPRSATGTNTAQSTSAIAITGPDTSCMAWMVASRALILPFCI